MKRIFSILLVVVLMLCVAGCSSTEQNNSELNNESSNKPALSSDTSDKNSEAVDKNQDKTEKTLVVYFSATGNTQKIAEYIAAATDSDVYELVPVEPYSDEDLNWNDENSRVHFEHDNPSERDVTLVSTTVDNFDDYETIFIGYPIWWGIAAWPVDNFVKENDFTGKTVIPFCTAASSDIGESGDLLAEMAGTGEWQEGRRFYGNSTEEEISRWIDSLMK